MCREIETTLRDGFQTGNESGRSRFWRSVENGSSDNMRKCKLNARRSKRASGGFARGSGTGGGSPGNGRRGRRGKTRALRTTTARRRRRRSHASPTRPNCFLP